MSEGEIVPFRLKQQLEVDVSALRNGDPLTLGVTLKAYDPRIGLSALRNSNLTLKDASAFFAEKSMFIARNPNYQNDPAYDVVSKDLNWKIAQVIQKIDGFNGVVFDDDLNQLRGALDQLNEKEPSLKALFDYTYELVNGAPEADVDIRILSTGDPMDSVSDQIRIGDQMAEAAAASTQTIGQPDRARNILTQLRHRVTKASTASEAIQTHDLPGEIQDTTLGLDMYTESEIEEGIYAIAGGPSTDFSHIYIGNQSDEWMIGSGLDEGDQRYWRLKVRKVNNVYVIDVDRHEKVAEDGLHWNSLATIMVQRDHSPIVKHQATQVREMPVNRIVTIALQRLEFFQKVIDQKDAHIMFNKSSAEWEAFQSKKEQSKREIQTILENLKNFLTP